VVALALFVVVLKLPFVRALALLAVPLHVAARVRLVLVLFALDHVLVVAPLEARLVGALLGRLGVHVVLAVAAPMRLAIMVARQRLHVLGAVVHLCVGNGGRRLD